MFEDNIVYLYINNK